MKNIATEMYLSKNIFILFFFTKFVLLIIKFFLLKTKKKRQKSFICIEAGIKGWDSLELKELYQSACEYVGDNNVYKLIIVNEKNYINQVHKIIKNNNITHYVYDPRSISGGIFKKIFKSFCIAILLTRNGVIPIVILTDISIRIQRAQGAIVSAIDGVVVCFMSAREIGKLFPHQRLIGPSLMPFSNQTMNYIDKLNNLKTSTNKPKALFIGALYEPRTTLLKDIQSKLKENGYSFEIRGRQPGETRVTNEQYWSLLCNSDIIVTTASQMVNYQAPDGKLFQIGADKIEIPQLVYRYLEALACGKLLVAPVVPGISRFFTPWEHFIPFETANNGAKLISHYLDNDKERLKIAQRGNYRAKMLIQSRIFWVSIDASLNKNAIF